MPGILELRHVRNAITDDFDATVITTYPGTPYFDEAVETSAGIWTYTCQKSGDRLHSVEVDYRQVAEYYKGAPGNYTAFVYTDKLTSEQLVSCRDWLESDVRETLSIVDRAYLIDEGRVVSEGTKDFLINDPISRQLYLGERFQM